MGYVINVGTSVPEKVVIAVPTRDGEPGNKVAEVYRNVGSYVLVNRARVWARRVLPDGNMPKDKDGNEKPIEVLDPQYKGHLEFLTWGDFRAGAQQIEIRFLRQSSTLDYDYQRLVQKIETKVEEGLDQIILQPGENKFDEKADALLIQFLQVYPQNRDSVSKNPDSLIKGYLYWELNDKNVDKSFIKQKEASAITNAFVISLSEKDDNLKTLFEILTKKGVDFGTVNHLSPTSDIYTALLRFSDNAGEFGAHINGYKEEIYGLFDKFQSFNALDITKNGTIAVTVEQKSVIVFNNVEGTGKGMIKNVVEKFYQSHIHAGIGTLKTLAAKLK